MNIKSTLKTLPIIGVIALGLAITPAYAIADNNGRSHARDHDSHKTFKKSNKSHKKTDRGERRHNVHAYDAYGHKNMRKSHRNKHYRGHDIHKHKKHNRHQHGNRHWHKHGHTGHTHSYYVVNDYDQHGHYDGFDRLRFMIGLHTDNVDIIFRD